MRNSRKRDSPLYYGISDLNASHAGTINHQDLYSDDDEVSVVSQVNMKDEFEFEKGKEGFEIERKVNTNISEKPLFSEASHSLVLKNFNTSKKATSNKTRKDHDFEEHRVLEEADAHDSLVKKRSLRFHVNRIDKVTIITSIRK